MMMRFGYLAEDKTTVTSDGAGIVLETETANTVVNGNTTTETLTDYNASNVVLDSTVTTTGATGATGATAPNGSPVQTATIGRDPTGAGHRSPRALAGVRHRRATLTPPRPARAAPGRLAA